MMWSLSPESLKIVLTPTVIIAILTTVLVTIIIWMVIEPQVLKDIICNSGHDNNNEFDIDDKNCADLL